MSPDISAAWILIKCMLEAEKSSTKPNFEPQEFECSRRCEESAREPIKKEKIPRLSKFMEPRLM
jgi:hypothetical protein